MGSFPMLKKNLNNSSSDLLHKTVENVTFMMISLLNMTIFVLKHDYLMKNLLKSLKMLVLSPFFLVSCPFCVHFVCF